MSNLEELAANIVVAAKKQARAAAELLSASHGRSICRHASKEAVRAQYLEMQEKISEARIEDVAVASKGYQDACNKEANCLLANKMAEVELREAELALELGKLG